MIIYDSIKSDFIADVMDQKIAIELQANIYNKMHRKTGLPEFHSWENSLQYMMNALIVSNIPDNAGIAIEYNIPQTSKRIDFIISGYDKEKRASAVIVELKQWEEIQPVCGMDAVVDTWTGGAERRVAHPSYQAWSYASLINDYNQTVQNQSIELYPCAFLHNYLRKEGGNDPLDEAQYQIYEEEAPAFSKGETRKLGAFIRSHIETGDHSDVIYRIDHGKLKPSKSLQDSLVNMVKGKREFVMVDEQKVIYETILDLSRKSHSDSKKRTIIVQGGPGTGKTVVAVNLLAALTKQDDQFCQYVTKNRAPRQVYLKKLKEGFSRKSSVDNLFKGADSYWDAQSNLVDTVLVDEAHRLRNKSSIFHGENQVKELINSSKCSVFFIDEEQQVTFQDIGSINEIKRWAQYYHSNVTQLKLLSQFRCNGSDGYLAWIDNALEIRETANFSMEDTDYDFQVFDTPEEVRDLIFEKNKVANKSRIVAGYCWNWDKEKENDPAYHDIKIGNFEMSWNLGNTSTWAIDPDSVQQAGCIHTCQGLEFDYVGVIIGPDMRYENGHVITDYTKRAKTDKSLNGMKKVMKESKEEALTRADHIIRNTYRTLMTRGMKGCYVYCTDKALAEHLKEMTK